MSESKPKAAPKSEPKTETVTIPPVVYSPDAASGYMNPKPKEKK